MFVEELNGCGCQSRWSHLNLRFRTCFKQRGNWIHSETHTWQNKNTFKCTVQISSHNTAQSFKNASLAKWLSVCLRNKWLLVWVLLQSLKVKLCISWIRNVPCAFNFAIKYLILISILNIFLRWIDPSFRVVTGSMQVIYTITVSIHAF